MPWRLGTLVCVLVLAVPLPAKANWFRSRPPAVAVSSYYLGPAVCVPSYALLAPVGFAPVLSAPVEASPGVGAPSGNRALIPGEPPRRIATPVPAPASQDPARPASPPMPPASEPRESQSYYDAYAASQTGTAAATGTCSVGFWNSTARPVTVRVAGQVQFIQPGRGVTLELPRTFTWQLDDRQPQPARALADQAGLDIVIRR